jgi:putative DNA primase/helicase
MASRTGREGVWAGFMEHGGIFHNGAGRRLPALVGKVASYEGRAINLHLTFLSAVGSKSEFEPTKKVMAGKLPDGCAIRIGDAAPVMGVAEGVETAISASIMYGIPVWACVNGILLSKWIPPAVSEKIYIFADNDKNYAGQSKAYHLANRLHVQFKREVEVLVPPEQGQDWNDVHMGQLLKLSGAGRV